MSTALVFFNEISDTPSKAQRELLTFAARFDQSSVAVATEVSDAAREVLGTYGVSTVWQSATGDSGFLTHELSVLDAAVTASAAQVVLLGNDNFSREIAARIAVRRNGAIITDATDVSADLVVTKDELAGSYNAQATTTGELLLVTVKPNSIDDAPAETATSVQVKTLEVAATQGPLITIVSTENKVVSDRPALGEARIVVAGGRGVNGDFSQVEDLADALGAAIGASRAATDAGWISHDAQVGQTGVTVSPQLYISAGISGAIQQKAGMQTSKYIIAINKDVDAPIFEIADLGIVGDITKVLPQAAEEIRRRQA